MSNENGGCVQHIDADTGSGPTNSTGSGSLVMVIVGRKPLFFGHQNLDVRGLGGSVEGCGSGVLSIGSVRRIWAGPSHWKGTARATMHAPWLVSDTSFLWGGIA